MEILTLFNGWSKPQFFLASSLQFPTVVSTHIRGKGILSRVATPSLYFQAYVEAHNYAQLVSGWISFVKYIMYLFCVLMRERISSLMWWGEEKSLRRKIFFLHECQGRSNLRKRRGKELVPYFPSVFFKIIRAANEAKFSLYTHPRLCVRCGDRRTRFSV